MMSPRASRLNWLVTAALVTSVAGCAIDDTAGSDPSDHAQVMQQPVFLQPEFVLDGLDELPNGIQLDELHLGVGAIFLDLLDSDDGVAYANRTPFQLHFIIREGRVTALAPEMTLPQGGRYQVSVQLEPQIHLDEAVDASSVASLESPSDEASLVVSGRLSETTIDPDDGGDDSEPAPLPWRPTEAQEVGRLQRTTSTIPFRYSSQRTVRFSLDEVDLVGATHQSLIMELQVGDWVTDTMRPALYDALDTTAEGQIADERIEDIDEALKAKLDESGDGIDGLVGGMRVEVE